MEIAWLPWKPLYTFRSTSGEGKGITGLRAFTQKLDWWISFKMESALSSYPLTHDWPTFAQMMKKDAGFQRKNCWCLSLACVRSHQHVGARPKRSGCSSFPLQGAFFRGPVVVKQWGQSEMLWWMIEGQRPEFLELTWRRDDEGSNELWLWE